MREEGQIRALGDDELLATLRVLVQRDHDLLAEMLAHLAELDQRRLYLDLGFPSLYSYCTSALGMCESSAMRRITAARVCRKFPDVLARVAKGDLHLSAVCSLSPHLDWNNAPDLIAMCSNQSRRKVDEILAARFPRADVREKVRLDPLSVNRYGLHFTIDTEALEELEKVRALARHRIPGGELSELFKLAMRTLRLQLEKQRFSVHKKERARSARATPTPSQATSEPSPPLNDLAEANAAVPLPVQADIGPDPTPEASLETRVASPPPAEAKPNIARRPSAEVAREVYARDGGQCTFVAQDG